MKALYDVAVIGAGPAGLVAATVAARHALATVLFDEQAAPGGQIYGPPTAGTNVRPGDAKGSIHDAALVEVFRQSGATWVPDATVWSAGKGNADRYELGVVYGAPGARSSRIVSTRAVIIATGALERPFPIPGGTLPGVMTAAGAQVLLKTAAIGRTSRVVLAGNGALLWRLAAQCLDTGIGLVALFDTTPRGVRWRCLPGAWDIARAPNFLRRVAEERAVRRAVRVIANVTALGASGPDRVESIQFDAAGTAGEVSADLLFLHQGLVPDINLGTALGCAHRWNDARASFEPVVDAWGGSTLPDVFFAGDAAGVAGSEAAEARGELAALAVANALGRIDAKARDTAAEKPRAALRRALRGAAFLDALRRPADAFRIPRGDTVVCRCENVTAAQVVDAVRSGASGPNQVKAFSRCGMGPCQGRFCGITVTEMVARECRISPETAGYFRLRWPVKPITLAELASLPSSPDAERAIARTTPH
ncbi:MAG: NAD(P)/FAD-dependent oxidoreductase [Betaproteobacteria bacterium]